MTDTGNENTVFVSYAKEDSATVVELTASLENAGINVWLDKKDLFAGHEWKNEIEIAIEQACLFVFCLSSKSCSKKGFVQHEIRHAYEQARLRPESEVYIVPIRLDDCTPPRALRHLQYIDLFEPGGVSKLIYSIKQHLNWLPQRSQAGATARKLKETGELQLDPEQEYVLIEELQHKPWHDRLSSRLSKPSSILACLERFELDALYLAHRYDLESKFGTFSAILTEQGEHWLRKALSFNLLQQIARRDNEHSGFVRTVTVTLTDRGREVIQVNESTPLAALSVPPSLSALSLFDIELADNLSWRSQVSDGLVRVHRNKHWEKLLEPLVSHGLYAIEKENDKYLTLSCSRTIYRIGNLSATYSQHKMLRRVEPLRSTDMEFLVQCRNRQRSARLPYFRVGKDDAPPGAITALKENDLVGFRRIGATIFGIMTALGFAFQVDGTFEEWEDDEAVELFDSIRATDE